MKLLQWYIVNKKYVKYLKFFDNKIENIDYKSIGHLKQIERKKHILRY